MRMSTVRVASLAVAVVCGVVSVSSAAATPATRLAKALRNAETFPDTSGKHINAHGGGFLFHNGTYYWYGESRSPKEPGVRWPATQGTRVYSSKDLYNWKDEGLAFEVVDDPESPVTRGCTLERPKVIYNAKTGKFVMWFHLELKGQGYGPALTALAVGDKPTGPFTFVKALRPNAGKWPIDFPESAKQPLTREETKEVMKPDYRKALVEGAYTRRDFAGGQMSRDMTLFVDPDTRKAYHIASAEENYTLNIHELNDDYTDFTGKWTRVAPGGHNEAPALVKHGGRYYILASGCTGWDPNPARYLVADNIWGPWRKAENPCRGVNPANKMGPEKTWGGQSTAILPVQGKPGAYIAMFDVWRPSNLVTSGYIWAPLRFEGGKMVIDWHETWDLSVFDRKVARR